MLYAKTPIGKIQVPEWQEKEVAIHSDEELLLRAVIQHKKFCISPAVYAMIENRGLERELQKRINPSIGMNHFTLSMTYGW